MLCNGTKHPAGAIVMHMLTLCALDALRSTVIACSAVLTIEVFNALRPSPSNMANSALRFLVLSCANRTSVLSGSEVGVMAINIPKKKKAYKLATGILRANAK